MIYGSFFEGVSFTLNEEIVKGVKAWLLKLIVSQVMLKQNC
jgi:hypothetical protein